MTNAQYIIQKSSSFLIQKWAISYALLRKEIPLCNKVKYVVLLIDCYVKSFRNTVWLETTNIHLSVSVGQEYKCGLAECL